MNQSDYKLQIDQLIVAIQKHVDAHGVTHGVGHCKALTLFMCWLEHLLKYEKTGSCDSILENIHSAAIECSAYIALGLIRPAMFAMRAQIDAVFSWLYYKDHTVEWNHVVKNGEGFKMRGEIFEFFSEYLDRFRERYTTLLAHRVRKVPEPYRLLSAHIHGQGELVIPSFKSLGAIVYPEIRCIEAVELQSEVSEYINDVLFSYFADKWASLPSSIVEKIKARVPAEKLAKLLS